MNLITLAVATLLTLSALAVTVTVADKFKILSGSSANIQQLLWDPDNEVIIAGSSINYRVYKWNPKTRVGISLAGNGVNNDADNSVALSASFREPRGITMLVDNTGTIIGYLVSSYGGHCLRRILRAGNNPVTTVAGSCGSTGTSDATGVAASFNQPYGLDYHKNAKYHVIADVSNHKIRRAIWDSGTSFLTISTLVGTGTKGDLDGLGSVATLDGPAWVALYPQRASNPTVMFISEQGEGGTFPRARLRRVTPLTGGASSNVITYYTPSSSTAGRGLAIFERTPSSDNDTLLYFNVANGLDSWSFSESSAQSSTVVSPTAHGSSCVSGDIFSPVFLTSNGSLAASILTTSPSGANPDIDFPSKSSCWFGNKDPASSSAGLTVGGVVGIVVGSVGIVVLLLGVLPYCLGCGFFFCCCKKQEDDEDEGKEGDNNNNKNSNEPISPPVKKRDRTGYVPGEDAMIVIPPGNETDLKASLDAASVCAAVTRGEISPEDAATQLEASAADKNAFTSDIAAGKVRGWASTLRQVPQEDANGLRESATFAKGATGIFSSLANAPAPVGILCGLLGGVSSLASRVQLNKFECQLLAHRVSRLLPILIRASQMNITSACGIFSEMRDVIDRAVEIVQDFVPPNYDSGAEPWFGARFYNWCKHKINVVAASPDYFLECHNRLNRVIQEASFAAQLDANQDMKSMQRTLAEIKKNCDADLDKTVADLTARLETALATASEETRAEITAAKTDLATMFTRVEKKIDSLISQQQQMFRRMMKEAEFKDLSVDPERVEVDEDVILGRGGFGQVYRATFDHAIQCAAKVAHAETSEDARAVLREAKLNQELNRNPGVVMSLGVVTKEMRDGSVRQLLLMERCNCSLSAVVQAQQKPLSVSVVFHVLGSVCSAVLELHKRSIVHRDLKPQNILLSNSVPPLAKLNDFGSAKSSQLQALAASMSTSMNNLGAAGTTVGFAAPEIIHAAIENANNNNNNNSSSPTAAMRATNKADIFSIGATVFSLLTNESPMNVSKDDVPESWPPKVQEFVKLCISRSPSQRPDINEVLRRVREISKLFPLSSAEGKQLADQAHHIASVIEEGK